MAVDLTLMNLPDALYERIKRSAKAHQRSPDSEAIVWLESAAPPDTRDPADILALADAVRLTPRGEFSHDDIDRFKREGRP